MKNLEVVVDYQEIKQEVPDISTMGAYLETIHFVDENGRALANDCQESLDFDDKRPVQTFASITVPVVPGYFAEEKQVKGKSIMKDDAKKAARNHGQISQIRSDHSSRSEWSNYS